MRYPRKGVIQIAEIANGIMDPLLSKRAGINTALLGSWDEIAGDDFADCTRPEKITWPRRDEGPDRGGYQPGVLTIACEGARALFLTHAQGELIARINGFFGFPAVRQIRIVQKPVSQPVPRRRKPPPLRGDAAKRLDDMMDGIESEALRKAVERLGTAVMQKKKPRGGTI
ncbi:MULTISPECIES: DUF721 domain-containing protein [Rhizobium/Agrobacterium group]|jgi:hypothetical protein|uniref:DUF721 domain-containing protein n=2 Tax=Rhizobium/Agrobacterium group TaxID=227290 RepID=A0AA86FU69_AGRTU|nr:MULTISPECIES: DUF721 domain-containing protein [Rhizobium/Agrobacterium group]AHK00661.1 hypothetical protein X971_0768 [Agrobacterium tumefaciens LBA4213 (Ach5)]AKC06497.1 hypothetical protein Ach5_07180 [Agrobacterium tumefaciens]EHJ99154.1 hypothetical protein AT5A_03915 [Agrobacterium tumefaciens 5A]MDP9559468.1 hypothetical protein [Rhizobium nepotum]MDZ7927838.1 DUF721 domain-containing protein [Agrobacterium sp.]QDG92458.1 DUF721 domain-containing protein [Rhizobium sp. NIBRBAC00050